MNEEPQLSSREFAESLQELRDDLREEFRRDVRGLAEAIERRPEPKPGVSPLALLAGVLGALFVGAAGMSWYDSTLQTEAQAVAPPVDVREELKTAMSPYTQELGRMTEVMVSAQQSATEDSRAHGLLLDRLAKSVANLEQTTEAQKESIQERVDLLANELVGKMAGETEADGKPIIAARPPVPADSSAVRPANAETDVTDADDGLVAVDERPATVSDDEQERGELVIDNPSEYELKLLINGEPVDIKARGVTTFDVSVGAIKTQIASLPELAQTWDKWETVDGVKRLTIKVESGNGSYILR